MRFALEGGGGKSGEYEQREGGGRSRQSWRWKGLQLGLQAVRVCGVCAHTGGVCVHVVGACVHLWGVCAHTCVRVCRCACMAWCVCVRVCACGVY